MPLQWKPRDNKLTTPPSYAAFPVVSNRIDIDQLATLINEQIPTISVPAIKAVLICFEKEVKHQLSKGNGITLENFLSIYPSISQRINNEDDQIFKSSVEINLNLAITLVEEIRAVITFEKLPYIPIKQPEILSAFDSNSGIERWINGESGFTLRGNNLRYNIDAADEGVFLTSPAGNEIKQTNISVNNNALSIFTSELDSNLGPAGVASVENSLFMKSRYTDNGSLRTGYFSGYIRQTNIVGDSIGNNKLFVSGASVDAPILVNDYQGIDTTCFFRLVYTGDNKVLISAGGSDTQGEQVEITGNHEYALDGAPSLVTIEVLDFTRLVEILVLYQRYILEVVSLSVVDGTPIVNYSPFSTQITDCIDDSGNTISCVGSGQNGEFQTGEPIPSPRFTDNSDGTITDNSTGIIWCRNGDPFGDVTFDTALAMAAGAEDGLYGLSDGSSPGDWKMPNIAELLSLYDFRFSYPSLSNLAGDNKNGEGTNSFTNTPTGLSPYTCFSSTTFMGSKEKVHSVNFSGNNALIDKTTSNKTLLCKVSSVTDTVLATGAIGCYNSSGISVPCLGSGQDAEYSSGSPLPEDRFQDNLDGTITDLVTNLIWKADTFMDGTLYQWESAFNAASLYPDFRIPTINELLSLADYGKDPAVIDNSQGFFQNLSGLYISSGYSTNVFANYKFTFDVDNGVVDLIQLSSNAKVWLIKK